MVPDLFAGGVCLYLERAYFDNHTLTGCPHGEPPLLSPERSLAREWGLVLPAGFGERGLLVEQEAEDPDDSCRGEHWFFGEV